MTAKYMWTMRKCQRTCTGMTSVHEMMRVWKAGGSAIEFEDGKAVREIIEIDYDEVSNGKE